MPAVSADRQREPEPQPGIMRAGEHGDTAGHAVHADHGQVELAHHHRQAQPERHQADSREGLQRAVGGRRAEELAVAPIHRGEQDDAGCEDGERPGMGTIEMVPQLHRPLPRACRMMTARTISPAARYCHSCRSPLSSNMTCTAAMTIAPANVRTPIRDHRRSRYRRPARPRWRRSRRQRHNPCWRRRSGCEHDAGERGEETGPQIGSGDGAPSAHANRFGCAEARSHHEQVAPEPREREDELRDQCREHEHDKLDRDAATFPLTEAGKMPGSA